MTRRSKCIYFDGRKKKRTKLKKERKVADDLYQRAMDAHIDVASCTNRKPCKRLACRYCRAVHQRRMDAELTPMLERKLTKDPKILSFITIIPDFGKTSVGDLPYDCLIKFRQRLDRIIRDLPGKPSAILCIDVSLNEDVDGSEHWQWHVHGLCEPFSKKARKQLNQKLTSQADVEPAHRPVRMDKIRDLTRLVDYIAKPNFFQKQARADETGKKLWPTGRTMDWCHELDVMRALLPYSVTKRIFKVRPKKFGK